MVNTRSPSTPKHAAPHGAGAMVAVAPTGAASNRLASVPVVEISGAPYGRGTEVRQVRFAATGSSVDLVKAIHQAYGYDCSRYSAQFADPDGGVRFTASAMLQAVQERGALVPFECIFELMTDPSHGAGLRFKRGRAMVDEASGKKSTVGLNTGTQLAVEETSLLHALAREHLLVPLNNEQLKRITEYPRDVIDALLAEFVERCNAHDERETHLDTFTARGALSKYLNAHVRNRDRKGERPTCIFIK